MPTLFDCHRSRVPALAIVAHIPSPEKNPWFTSRSRNAATIANWCRTRRSCRISKRHEYDEAEIFTELPIVMILKLEIER